MKVKKKIICPHNEDMLSVTESKVFWMTARRFGAYIYTISPDNGRIVEHEKPDHCIIFSDYIEDLDGRIFCQEFNTCNNYFYMNKDTFESVAIAKLDEKKHAENRNLDISKVNFVDNCIFFTHCRSIFDIEKKLDYSEYFLLYYSINDGVLWERRVNKATHSICIDDCTNFYISFALVGGISKYNALGEELWHAELTTQTIKMCLYNNVLVSVGYKDEYLYNRTLVCDILDTNTGHVSFSSCYDVRVRCIDSSKPICVHDDKIYIPASCNHEPGVVVFDILNKTWNFIVTGAQFVHKTFITSSSNLLFICQGEKEYKSVIYLCDQRGRELQNVKIKGAYIQAQLIDDSFLGVLTESRPENLLYILGLN